VCGHQSPKVIHMLTTNRITAFGLAALLLGPAAAGGQSRPIQLTDFTRQVGISNPTLSPDGKTIVVVVSRANLQDNRFDRTLVAVDATSGAQHVLTPGRYRVGNPRWAPKGDRLAFLDADDKGKRQVWIMPAAGGEAQRLTSVSRGVGSYSWRPDGAAIAFLAEEEPPARTGEDRLNRSFEVGDNGYLAEDAPLPAHLWTVGTDSGAPRMIPLAPGSIDDFSWSADGARIAFVRLPSAHSGAGIHASLSVVDVASGREQVADAGPASLSSPDISRDGRWLAYRRPSGAEPAFTPSAVFVAPLAGGERRNITSRLDRNVSGYRWMPGSDAMLITAPDGTRNVFYLQPINGAPRRLDLGSVQPGGFTVSPEGMIVFVGNEPTRPAELYVMASTSDRPKRLTSFNSSLDSLRLGKVEGITWKGPNGFDEDGVLVYPPDFQPGRTYPLVLVIHGGPMGASTESFDPVAQIMAAQGWVIFSPNYRGSNNRGAAYQRAVVNDAGDGPGRDVMAGIAAVRAHGFVDTTRIAVSGWSYGGYMTAWLTSHYTGWRVAVAGAAVTDWFDWYALADLNVWAGYGLGGSPWLGNTEAGYRAQSPITFANRIRTPTLILSDVYDPRVTVTQSYKLYHALKDNGTEVKFVAYPVGGHFPGDPIHQRDIYKRWMEWIAEHFAAPAPRAASVPRR
jgi:dipeptidyl aminopeptidase/acylaminoacyl peptidase